MVQCVCNLCFHTRQSPLTMCKIQNLQNLYIQSVVLFTNTAGYFQHATCTNAQYSLIINKLHNGTPKFTTLSNSFNWYKSMPSYHHHKNNTLWITEASENNALCLSALCLNQFKLLFYRNLNYMYIKKMSLFSLHPQLLKLHHNQKIL